MLKARNSVRQNFRMFSTEIQAASTQGDLTLGTAPNLSGAISSSDLNAALANDDAAWEATQKDYRDTLADVDGRSKFF
jgi:hypothetical protein